MKLLLVILSLVIIGIVWLLRQRARYMYVLRASVSTSDGFRHFVGFEHLHPETKPVEYVWLCLFFAAKMLYNMGNQEKHEEARELLLGLIAAVGETDLVGSDDIIQETLQPIEVFPGQPDRGAKTIAAKVAYFNPMSRYIWTSLPYACFTFQFPHSFLAIVQASLPKLDTMLRHRLQGSIARMAELYEEGAWDPASLHALKNVPLLAFLEAKVIGAN